MIGKFLEGKGALITGGNSGLGKGIAIEYAKRGAMLAIVGINEELLEETVEEIKREYKKDVIPIKCDVSKSIQVEEMVKQAFDELPNVYILNNNAGIGGIYGPDLLRIKEKTFDRILEVNLKGQWLVAKHICKKMKKQEFKPLAGKVIHTASVAATRVDEKLSAYSISKAGVIAIMQLLSRSLAPRITVNAISPGYHNTRIYKNSEEVMRLTMEDGHVKTPLNRLGTIQDVANVSVFLASPSSDFITGHNFPIDGGIAEVGVPSWYFKTDF